MTDEASLPPGNRDERELQLGWLRYLRGAVLRKVSDLDDTAAAWRPDGALISPAGILNHLTHVEWRWIDGGFDGAPVSRSEAEFTPRVPIARLVAAYRARQDRTEAIVRATPLEAVCRTDPEVDLRWVLSHLINETARHAGHADAVRELWDGTTGE